MILIGSLCVRVGSNAAVFAGMHGVFSWDIWQVQVC